MVKKFEVKIPTFKANSYNIFIGISLRNAALEIAKKFPSSKCFIITDTNVAKLYLRRFKKELKNAGIDVFSLIFKAGETSKTRRTKETLEDEILKIGADRNSVIIALGGGVVGDIAGFVAATINRGIPYIQIPTTLLSQVDSSVGGKVAVNHPRGKNIIGAFYQPAEVYIDISTLNTLSDNEYRNGLAEVVKYAAILDARFFEYLVKNKKKILKRDPDILQFIITRSIKHKSSVISKDEKEKSYRKILNFGHTIGHALEKISDYKISHGNAISIGMVVEAKFSGFLGKLNNGDIDKLILLLSDFGLPVKLPREYSISKIIKATKSDKKADGQVISYTLLEKIGKGIINIQLNEDDVRFMLKTI